MLLALPVATTLATQRIADALGARLGREGAAIADLARASGPTLAAQGAGASPSSETSAPTPPVEASLGAAPVAAGRSAPKSKQRGTRRNSAPNASPAATRGIRISASQILGLARIRAMPHAVPVPATGQHPAGLRLIGVGALGVGMRDGDVLSRVSGAPVNSVAAVVAMVLSHRGRLAREITGEFWRNGERWVLLVEQPYLQPKSPTGAEPAPAP